MSREDGSPASPLKRWAEFWFAPRDPSTLAVVRICCGLCLLWNYGDLRGHALDFIGPEAWVNADALPDLSRIEGIDASPVHSPSIWRWCTSDAAARIAYDTFLLAIVGLTVGFMTRTMTVLVWIGHLSFLHRSFCVEYGIDQILAPLLLYLMVGPSGAALSVDRRLRRWLHPQAEDRGLRPDWSANLAIRLIQVQMCIVYFCSGAAKLQGATWWNGSAVWHAIMVPEMWTYDVRWIGTLGLPFLHLATTVASGLTLFYEIAFPFLIWQRSWRRPLLILGVLLHGSIGSLMGLGAFSAVMITGCLSFADFSFLTRLTPSDARNSPLRP